MEYRVSKPAIQPNPAFAPVDHDGAIERIFAHMETLKASALAAGDEALLKQIDLALKDSIERYCEAKRTELAGKLAATHAARRK